MIELFPIPKRWARIRLGDICDIRGGVPAPQAEEAFSQTGIPFVRMRDVGRHHLTRSLCVTDQRLANEHFQVGRYELTPRGSILMPRSGSVGLNHRAILTVDAVIVSHLCALVPMSDDLDIEFLYRFLCLVDMRKLTKKTTGLDSVAFADLRELAVPKPPLMEQRRVVTLLDRADRLRTGKAAAISKLDDLAKGIFYEMFGDPAANSMEWPTVALGELGQWQSGGTPPRHQSDLFQGDVPWFSSGELGPMYIEESAEQISEAALRKTTAKRVPRDALMLGMYDTAALKASIAGRECSCNQAIAFAAICPGLAHPLFVYFTILIGREYYRRMQRGVRQKNLNLSMIRDIRIPLPPLARQLEFVRRIGSIERLRGTQRESKTAIDALFASLQHRAFCGEL